jgi:hypothetical protein
MVEIAIALRIIYPHPIDQVWGTLTSLVALATWLIPNDVPT